AVAVAAVAALLALVRLLPQAGRHLGLQQPLHHGAFEARKSPLGANRSPLAFRQGSMKGTRMCHSCLDQWRCRLLGTEVSQRRTRTKGQPGRWTRLRSTASRSIERRPKPRFAWRQASVAPLPLSSSLAPSKSPPPPPALTIGSIVLNAGNFRWRR